MCSLFLYQYPNSVSITDMNSVGTFLINTGLISGLCYVCKAAICIILNNYQTDIKSLP